jgi:hypothetical protein
MEKRQNIRHVNQGTCARRLQESQPSFFVNWTDTDGNQYQFFRMRYQAEKLYQELKQLENLEEKGNGKKSDISKSTNSE